MADDDLNLDLAKKKKKKPFNLEKALGDRDAEKNEDEPKEEDAAEVAGGGDDENLFAGKKKKKGSKKATEEGAAPTETTVKDAAPEDDSAIDFGDKKKKKKKDKTLKLDDAEEPTKEEEDNEPIEEDDGDDFGELKPKKKKGVTFEDDKDEPDGKDDDGAEFVEGDDSENIRPSMAPSSSLMKGAWLSSDRDYTYDELLTRVFDIMREKNPEYVGGEKKKIVMRPPQVVRVGTKKSSFANFTEICKAMRRQPKHLIAFLLAELGTTGSVDANNQLIIKGRFQQKQIENVLRRYIKEYVTCHTCRSPETLLQKDDQTRVVFLQCETCGSRCSVTKVSSGYQALTAKRAAIRAREV